MTIKVLLIDDDPDVRDAFELALDGDEYDVRTVDNGAKGLEIVDEFDPNVIFLDLHMPEMSGVEVLERIHEEHGDRFNIYIITAFYKMYLEPLNELANKGVSFELAQKPMFSEQIRQIAAMYD